MQEYINIEKTNTEIGKVTKKIIKILGLDYKDEMPIFIGKSNLKHMMDQHPKDFKKYGANIKEIIRNPTYLARNEKKKSIEFIKRYKVNDEFVLVAVRVSNNGIHLARTMYVMADDKVRKYFQHKYFYEF